VRSFIGEWMRLLRYWLRKMGVLGLFPENDPSRATMKSAESAARAKTMMRVDRSTLAGRVLGLGGA
jgi:hypothetical protein